MAIFQKGTMIPMGWSKEKWDAFVNSKPFPDGRLKRDSKKALRYIYDRAKIDAGSQS